MAVNVDSPSNEDASLRLKNLTSQATIQYSMKQYDEAAELYAHATELQAEINGELSPRNADLLYLYGRCLYQVAVKNSDVLGSKVAGEQKDEGSASKDLAGSNSAQAQRISDPKTTRSSGAVASTPGKSDGDATADSKPYFQFTGDENFDTSDEEEGDGGEETAAADPDEDRAEEDDFATAYEILDLARIMLVQNIEDSGTKNSETESKDSSQFRQIQERLADTYDLQAEISLEGERFEDAVADFRSALEWKSKILPFESNKLAEAHYKLSLALEFSSVTQPRDANGELEQGKSVMVDKEKRADAIKQMELAISSCKARISAEEANQHSEAIKKEGEDSNHGAKAIEEVKEIVSEMEQRLIELRQSPAALKPAIPTNGADALTGVLSQIMGASAEEKKAALDSVVEGARDVTGLVKKRKPTSKDQPERQNAPNAVEQNGKRKRVEEVMAPEKKNKS